jgi:RecG-like helicase
VGLKDLKRRLSVGSSALQQSSLQDRYGGLGDTSIGEVPRRTPVRMCGEVTRQKIVPRAGSPVMELTVSDGTGDVIVIFTGRRSISGLSHGRGVRLQGVAHEEHGRLVMLNPAYTLLPKHE